MASIAIHSENRLAADKVLWKSLRENDCDQMLPADALAYSGPWTDGNLHYVGLPEKSLNALTDAGIAFTRLSD